MLVGQDYINIFTSEFYKLCNSLKVVIIFQMMLRKCENSEFKYDFFAFKICGILKNLVKILRVLVGLGYFIINTSDFYKFDISLKRSYISIRWHKENLEFWYDFLLSKFAGSAKFWV